MSRDKQNKKNCVNCIHNLICEKLEEFRDPLGWVNTEGEFVCSYYDTVYYDEASDVAEEIFAEIDDFQRTLRHIFLNMCEGNDYNTLNLLQIDNAIEALFDSKIAELKKKYTQEK